MISVICLSPAVDITYRVDSPVLGESNRVTKVLKRPGGKGVNVARGLQQLGANPKLHLPLGGTNGAWIRTALESSHIDLQSTEISSETRSALAVVSEEVTVFNEPAAVISEAELASLEGDLERSEIMIVSGSIPNSISPERFGKFLALCKTKTDQLIVDTSGEYLITAAKDATYLKPNAWELLQATGLPLNEAVEKIRKHGAKVILSLGEDGVELHSDEVISAKAEAQVGNPTGAGDAMVAGFAYKLNESEKTALEFGCALSAASVRSEVAGEFDQDDLTEILNQMGVN